MAFSENLNFNDFVKCFNMVGICTFFENTTTAYHFMHFSYLFPIFDPLPLLLCFWEKQWCHKFILSKFNWPLCITLIFFPILTHSLSYCVLQRFSLGNFLGTKKKHQNSSLKSSLSEPALADSKSRGCLELLSRHSFKNYSQALIEMTWNLFLLHW